MQVKVYKVVFVFLCVVFLLLVLFLTANSAQNYSKELELKTQPYQLDMEFYTPVSTTVTIYYDYGYGFNSRHSQRLLLTGATQEQKMKFSISAWKNIKALRFNGWQNAQSEIQLLRIQHAQDVYVLNREELSKLNAGQPLVLSHKGVLL